MLSGCRERGMTTDSNFPNFSANRVLMLMKKLINRPEDVVEEMVEGLASAYPGLQRLPGQTVLIRSDLPASAYRPVAAISGGGSGHEPAHAGYVGRGMLSAAVAGEVFTSPGPDAVLGRAP